MLLAVNIGYGLRKATRAGRTICVLENMQAELAYDAHSIGIDAL